MAENINIKLLIDAAESAKTIQDTKKALRDLKSAALQVEEGSQAFNDITTAAGKLQDKVGDLAATTKFLGDDLKNLKGFTSIASGIAGSFAAAQGAAALFGGENKNLEASLLKVQSAMGVLQGIQAVGEVLQKESAATLFIQNGLRKAAIALAGEQAVATAAVAVANGTATVAQRALNAAMTANPIIALVALLVTATAALYAFSTSSDKSTKKTEEAKKASEDRTKALADESKAYGDFIGKEMAGYQTLATQLAQSNPQSQERLDLITKINETYGTTIKNLSDEKLFQDQVAKSVETYIGFLKQKYALQSQQKSIEESFGKQATLEKELLDLSIQRGVQQSILDAKRLTTYRDIDLTTTPEGKQLEQIDKVIKQKENQKLVEQGVVKAAVQNSITLSKSIEDSGLKVASETAKTSKKVVDTAEKTANKLADINDEYMKALLELSNDTTDIMLENKKLLADADGEYNAIQLQNIEIEKAQLQATKLQAAELAKLLKLKMDAAAVDGTAATPAEVKTFTEQITAAEQYKNYVIQTNATLAIVTTQGEKAILQIQKDYAIQRQKLFEETQKRVLASDEYDRFITFLNKTKELQNKLEDYEKKFGKKAAEQMKLDEKAREADKEYRAELELLVKTKEQLIATENALLLTNQRNVEYQKKISQELVDEGLQTQEDANKAVADTADANLKSAKTIAEALEVVRKAKQSLAEDPVQTTQTSKMVLQNKTGPEKTQIPTLSSEGELQKAYEKYKGQTEKLFDLQRQSNLDQLGNNEKSIEILSALYGEKFNVVKNGEDKINEILAKLPKRPENPVPVEFQFIPKKGQIGLKELLAIDNADVKKAMENLNVDLDKTYQANLDNEKKYFEKSTFENYNTQQQKLADSKQAYVEEITANRKINAFDTPYVLIKKKELKDKELEINKEFNDKDKTLKENHEENQLAIGLVYGAKTQEDVVQFGKDRLAEKERQAAEEQAIEDKKNAYLIAAGQSLLNTLRGFSDDMMQNTLNRIEQENQLRIDAIDAELRDFDNRDKQITAAEQAKIDERKVIEDKKALIQAENDKRLRDEKIKQFNINKAMDVIQIGINTAVAVSRSLIPPATVMIPFIIAAGAAEAFFVAAQQPNFADGGLVIGPGGPKDDMVNANLSNGEVVINAKSSKKYAGVLNAINQAGGGKAIPYRDNGVSNNPMSVADNTNMEDFKSLILHIVNRPIETYVKESSITNAQKSQSQQNRRTSF
jgi:hypothetical protein